MNLLLYGMDKSNVFSIMDIEYYGPLKKVNITQKIVVMN